MGSVEFHRRIKLRSTSDKVRQDFVSIIQPLEKRLHIPLETGILLPRFSVLRIGANFVYHVIVMS